jgi:hypothetical protein
MASHLRRRKLANNVIGNLTRQEKQYLTSPVGSGQTHRHYQRPGNAGQLILHGFT